MNSIDIQKNLDSMIEGIGAMDCHIHLVCGVTGYLDDAGVSLDCMKLWESLYLACCEDGAASIQLTDRELTLNFNASPEIVKARLKTLRKAGYMQFKEEIESVTVIPCIPDKHLLAIMKRTKNKVIKAYQPQWSTEFEKTLSQPGEKIHKELL